jgi:hypothetical protein
MEEEEEEEEGEEGDVHGWRSPSEGPCRSHWWGGYKYKYTPSTIISNNFLLCRTRPCQRHRCQRSLGLSGFFLSQRQHSP